MLVIVLSVGRGDGLGDDFLSLAFCTLWDRRRMRQKKYINHPSKSVKRVLRWGGYDGLGNALRRSPARR
jgi:hypothetical protein